METLTAQNLEYTYQGKYQKVTALSDVTCHFEKGKFYALIGRSGSGKTTLLSLLAWNPYQGRNISRWGSFKEKGFGTA